MAITFQQFKRFFEIAAFGLNLFVFIISIICTKKDNENFIEYTDLSKFFISLYVFLMILLILLHEIKPSIICSIFSKNIGVITSSRGKIIITFLIAGIYWTPDFTPQLAYSLIVFASTIFLLAIQVYFEYSEYKEKNKTASPQNDFNPNFRNNASPLYSEPPNNTENIQNATMTTGIENQTN